MAIIDESDRREFSDVPVGDEFYPAHYLRNRPALWVIYKRIEPPSDDCFGSKLNAVMVAPMTVDGNFVYFPQDFPVIHIGQQLPNYYQPTEDNDGTGTNSRPANGRVRDPR